MQAHASPVCFAYIVPKVRIESLKKKDFPRFTTIVVESPSLSLPPSLSIPLLSRSHLPFLFCIKSRLLPPSLSPSLRPSLFHLPPPPPSLLPLSSLSLFHCWERKWKRQVVFMSLIFAPLPPPSLSSSWKEITFLASVASPRPPLLLSSPLFYSLCSVSCLSYSLIAARFQRAPLPPPSLHFPLSLEHSIPRRKRERKKRNFFTPIRLQRTRGIIWLMLQFLLQSFSGRGTIRRRSLDYQRNLYHSYLISFLPFPLSTQSRLQ